MPEVSSDRFQTTIDRLLDTAERCYRLARGTTDRQAIEALLQLAEECEEKAAELRQSAG